jgi:Ca-activated chloride channel family protein
MNKVRLFSFFIISILTLTNIVSAQSDEDVISVDSSIVVMNATITGLDGKAVRGLQQNQFKIFEDGKEQEIAFFQAEETPFAAVILLDSSGSMEQRMMLARSAAINFLGGLRSNDVAAIYNFDSKVSLIQDFSNSRDMAESFFNLKASGMTVLNDAIYHAAGELAKRPEKRKAIIVLSDGEDTKSGRTSDKALKAALAANALIYTIDMSSPDTSGKQRALNQAALKNFAEKTGGTFVPTPGGRALREAFKNIVDELSVQYTLGYQPANLKKDGKWRALELRVARSNLVIRTRKGYNAPKN